MSDLWPSVFQITSSDPANKSFGTGFIIYLDQEVKVTYLLTCAHVVAKVGGPDNISIGGNKAMLVVSGAEDGTDLAVLQINGLLGPPLTLRKETPKQGFGSRHQNIFLKF